MSGIPWTNRTWNTIVGCSKKSPGCANCYAIKEAWRLAHNPNPKISQIYKGLVEKRGDRLEWTGIVRFLPERLEAPLHWKKSQMVFVDSMSDLFHESVTDEQLDQVFAVMAIALQHKFQVLTKRPERMLAYLSDPNLSDRVTQKCWDCGYGAFDGIFPFTNVWLGVSCENQKEADDRIPRLLETPAAIRFLSCEPLLEEVQLTAIRDIAWHPWDARDALRSGLIHQVIVGGESGPNARQCNVEWIRSIVQQCQNASVKVFVKQLGSKPVMNIYDWYEWADHQDLDRSNASPIGWDYQYGQPPLDTLCSVPVKGKGADPAGWPRDIRFRQWPRIDLWPELAL